MWNGSDEQTQLFAFAPATCSVALRANPWRSIQQDMRSNLVWMNSIPTSLSLLAPFPRQIMLNEVNHLSSDN